MTLETYKDKQTKKQNYQQTIYVDTIIDLLSLIKQLSKDDTLIYRGVNDARYKMYTSAQRHWLWQDNLYHKFGDGKSYTDYIYALMQCASKIQKVNTYWNKHKIPFSEMWLLTLMQHYEVPSPMLDFSHNIWSGLFFAFDKMKHDKDGDLDDYVSLYYTDTRIDWIQCNLQSVMQKGVEDMNEMVKNSGIPNLDTSEVERETKDLSYASFAQGIRFLPVEGPAIGVTYLDAPTIDFHSAINIKNGRIDAQKGLFICNFTDKEPLVELMNEHTKQKMFSCININKKLACIAKLLLFLHGRIRLIVYRKYECESNRLAKAFKYHFGS